MYREGKMTPDLHQEKYTRVVKAAHLFQQKQNKTPNNLNVSQQGIRHLKGNTFTIP